MRSLLVPILILLAIAVALRSDLFFYLLYVLIGFVFVSRLWLRQGLRQLRWERSVPRAGFPGETVSVAVTIRNKGLLPIPWLAVHESLPTGLRTPPMYREVLSLGAGEVQTLRYALVGSRRGYYALGPLTISTGDMLGFGERRLIGLEQEHLTIYPVVLTLADLELPATLPYDVLPSGRRLFSDPARPAGVRPYEPGDSVRQIDWKSTARSAGLQVRRYQPAIALETMLALAFTRAEYDDQFVYEETERAITATASLAAHLTGLRQPVGLCTNGRDPAFPEQTPLIPIGAGRAHLMEVLGVLGRLEFGNDTEMMAVVLRATAQIGWGGTLIVVSGPRADPLLMPLIALRRRGLNVVLILTDATPDDLARIRRHGIAAFVIRRDGRPQA